MPGSFFSFFEYFRSRVEAHPRARRWIMGIFLCGLSVWLLFPNLGTPRAIVFDETYYIPRAQRYINQVFFVSNDHPPLAPLLMALGQHLIHPNEPSNEFVNDSTITSSWPENVDIAGYRIFPALLGALLPLIIFLIIIQITQNDWMAVFMGLATALDNALVTQAHYALPDSTLVFFCYLSILCFAWLQTQENPTTRKTYVVCALFGVSAAAAFLVKLTGLFILIALPFYLYKLFKNGHRQKLFYFLLTFGGAFLTVFVLVWQVHFSILTKVDPNQNYEISETQRQIVVGQISPNPLVRFWIQITDTYQTILHFHENISPLDLNKTDEIGSPWYEWPIGGRAIPYRWATGETEVRMIYLLGNPAVWIISLLGIVGGIGMLLANLLFKAYRPKYFQWYLLLIGMYLVYMLSMARITRIMYLYHYFPPLLLGLVLFGLVFLDLPRLSTRTRAELLVLATTWIVISFWLYSPFTYYTPMTYTQVDFLNIWSPWDLRIP